MTSRYLPLSIAPLLAVSKDVVYMIIQTVVLLSHVNIISSELSNILLINGQQFLEYGEFFLCYNLMAEYKCTCIPGRFHSRLTGSDKQFRNYALH